MFVKYNKEWHSYHKIKWNYAQVKWLFRNLMELKYGHWPESPDGTGYIDIVSVPKGARRDANFCEPAEVAGYLEMRLKERGFDGLLVKAKYTWDEDMEQWSTYFQIPVEEINKRIDTVLTYIVEVSKE